MTNRIALVTGGMGGIGEAICKDLSNHGIRVIAGYHRKEEAALAWQKEMKAEGYHFDIAYGNVSDCQSCEQMINKILTEMGPIDILVNNAAITHDITFSKMKKEDWDLIINTDLNSIFNVTHPVIDSMKNRQYGRIINISSISGQRGRFGQVNYSTAKAGMIGFTKSLALEVAKKGITVNTVSPGYVKTEMVSVLPENIQQALLAEIPLGRFAEADEVARVVTFLADEKNGYITGANFVINGGQYLY